MYNKAISGGKANRNPTDKVSLFKEKMRRFIEECPNHLDL